MVKLDSVKKPIIFRVQTKSMAEYVAKVCEERGWHCIVGFEPGEIEDISDLENALNPPEPLQSEKIGRKEACPSGSGKKYKKCCGSSVD